jgi:hypothetical protein
MVSQAFLNWGCRMIVASFLAATLSFTVLQAQQPDAAQAMAAARAGIARLKAGDPYPAEWQEARWLKARAATADPDARALFERVFREQFMMTMRPSPGEAARMEAYQAVVKPELEAARRANATWLEGVLKRIGWFDISRYGEDASQAAWLIVQHADHDPGWQREILNVLAPRVESGDMQGRYFAYLMDRVMVNAGKPQTYGTQGRCVSGEWQVREVSDPVALDRLRADAGLEPFEAYRKRSEGSCR